LADVERELSGDGAFPLDANTIIRYENTNRLELQYKVEKIPVGYANNKWDIYETKNEQISNYITQIPDLITELQTPESIQYIKEKFIERENIDAKTNKSEIEFIKNSNLQTTLPEIWINTNQPYQQGGIIFCPHRQGLIGVKDTTRRGIANAIRQNLPCNDVGTFLGGDEMSDQDRFINNELPIMVATKAFGMGIDKSNVRFTINVNHSNSLEGFVQEAGRAGRDRKMALATILYSDFADVDKDVMMYFHNNTFMGATHEKQVMHELLSRQSIHYFISEDEGIEIQQTNNVSGFLATLLKAQPNQNIVSFISYIDDKDYNGLDKKEYIDKAIYRMCCIGLIDDFTQDYRNHRFRIVTKRKADGEYYQGLKRFLMRYYSADRAEEEIQKVPTYKGENEIHKCLGYLTEFIYEKIAVKRKRAIDDIRTFCIQGIDDSKDWKEINEDLKDFIYYYFNSKYAKDDYVADNGEDFSLKKDTTETEDTDKNKQPSSDTEDTDREESLTHTVLKYMRVVDDDLVGAGGTPKDNVKHLQGAVRLIRRSLTDTESNIKPTLDLLNAFCLFYLGTNNNETLEEELRSSYQDGLDRFSETASNYNDFWNFFEDFNKNITEKAGEIPVEKFNDMKEKAMITIHAKIIKNLTNKYTEK
jgi:ATP-dependent DNA helicase RecQ